MNFDDNVEAALKQIRKSIGKKVKYKRGTDTVTVDAARGNTFFRYKAEDNIRIQYEEKEFLIGVDDLVLAGTRVVPQRGDKIIEVYGTKTYTYQVIPTESSDDVWAYSDAGKSTYRVFAKLAEEGVT